MVYKLIDWGEPANSELRAAIRTAFQALSAEMLVNAVTGLPAHEVTKALLFDIDREQDFMTVIGMGIELIHLAERQNEDIRRRDRHISELEAKVVQSNPADDIPF